MIPRHRPPFGPLSLTRTAVRSVFSSDDVRSLERQYEQQLQVPFAVWLPSARYGITRVVQLTTGADATVFCPVFNCGAVHHAVQETGRTVEYVDCACGSYLMNGSTNSASTTSGHAVILSEMFGHRFSSQSPDQPLIARADVRIFDMAMAVPVASDLPRLTQSDVAVVSFGLGKSLYSGWGGMAFTFSDELAEDLRRCRSRDLKRFGKFAQFKTFCRMMARTTAHESLLYGHLRRLKNSGTSEHSRSSDAFSNLSPEWHRPPARLHLTAAVENLSAVPQWIEDRCRLAEVYRSELPAAVLPGDTIKSSDVALSHFSVRLPVAARDSIRNDLWNAGIDTGTLFPFPEHLVCKEDFPNAAIAAAEVLNLPLSCQLRRKDVSRICEHVSRALDEFSNTETREEEQNLPAAA